MEGVDQAGRLHDGQRHGEVAGGLGDLLLADRALVPPLLELGDHRREQLDDDGAGDVGHDAQAEDGQSDQGTPAEEVQEAEHARRRGRALQALQPGPVDPGHRDVGPDLVQGDDGEREDDLVAKVGNPEDVGEPGEHGPSSQLSPGAVVTSGSSGRCPRQAVARWRRAAAPARRYPRLPVMAASAAFENAWAETRTGRASEPWPRTLTSALGRTRPASTRVCDRHLVDAQGVERRQVDRGVLDAEGVGEPLQLGDALHEGELATLEAGRHGVAGLLPLGPATGRLVALAAGAAADPALGRGGTLGRCQIVELHFETSSTLIRCGTRAIMPRDLGAVGQLVGLADAAQARAPAACRGAWAWCRWPSASG